jgi:hypothetical protein
MQYKNPIVNILTWCDYADIVDEKMTILRTSSFALAESLPAQLQKMVAVKLQLDDLQPRQTLQMKLTDFEGSILHVEEVVLIPARTLSDKWVFQYVVSFQIKLEKIEYSLDLYIKETGTLIGTLPLPIVIKKYANIC